MTCKVSYFFFYMLLYCNWLYSFWWIFYIMENIIVLKMWDSIRISLMLRTKPLKLNCIECHKYYPTTHTFYLMKREKIISFHEVFCLFMMREIYIFFILFYFHYLTTIRQWKYCFPSKFSMSYFHLIYMFWGPLSPKKWFLEIDLCVCICVWLWGKY